MSYFKPCCYSIRLTEKLKSLDTKNVLDFELINKAIYWARKYHGDQKRKSGEAYYTHPLEVAYMISEHKLKTDIIVTSILHDTIEDTELTFEMIENGFGTVIANQDIQTIKSLPPEKIKKIIEETISTFIVLAMYLGIPECKNELIRNCYEALGVKIEPSYSEDSIF